jgi:hypothetical protein
MICENNLFIQTNSPEKKEYFMKILEEATVLFQSLIPLNGTKKECYGTDSDIYLEYITFDIADPDVINLIFYTHDTPCIEFCKRLAGYYSVNVQLVYFNEENNYSGKIDIYRNQLVRDERYTYWQGMYVYNFDIFWERIDVLFENETNFMELLRKNNLCVLGKDFEQLKYQFEEYTLFRQFENL